MADLIPIEKIQSRIYVIRDVKVMLDMDIAILYGVPTSQLKRQVRRNKDRFPEDFMFELRARESNALRCQNGISRWGGTRYRPMAFTEQGVAMLSSVLNSKRAIQVNIQIMRAFTRLREMAMTYRALAKKIDAMENRYDRQFKTVFVAIRKLVLPPARKKGRIGF